jgi:hypothetical protein
MASRALENLRSGWQNGRRYTTDMNATEVERLVRQVIVQRALPFAFVSVANAPPGWLVTVRAETGEVVKFALPDGRPVDMRTTVENFLEERT